MRITKLHIENFRGFRGEHEIEFSDSNIHAVVGVNGAGKTSVLDAVGMCLEELVNEFLEFESDISKNFKHEDINVSSEEAKVLCCLGGA